MCTVPCVGVVRDFFFFVFEPVVVFGSRRGLPWGLVCLCGDDWVVGGYGWRVWLECMGGCYIVRVVLKLGGRWWKAGGWWSVAIVPRVAAGLCLVGACLYVSSCVLVARVL